MSSIIAQNQETALVTKQNNLVEKIISDDFHSLTTRAGSEEFSLVTIDDEKLHQIAVRMDEINRGLNAFAKTNTQFVATALTLSEATPERNIRQIHAQIESKRGALADARFRLLKQQNELKRKLKKYEEVKSSDKYTDDEMKELDLERIEIEIEEIKTKMVDGRVHIEQAIKEIGMYQDALDDIVESFGLQNWDEKTMEDAEETYNLVRCFLQSIRSCRQIGYINEPNQEWLEQLGINPSFVQQEILIFLQQEREKMQTLIKENKEFADSMDSVDKFVDHMVTKYRGYALNRIRQRGINLEKYDKWIYQEPKGGE